MDKVQKLKDMLSLLSEGLTKKDFTEAFEALIKQLLALEKSLISKIDSKTSSAVSTLEEIQQTHKEVIARIEKENESSFSNMRKWATEKVNELFLKYQIKEKITEFDNKIQEVNQKIAEVKDYFDGKDGSPDTADQILEKITGLLEISDIKDLRKELDELKAIRRLGGGGFSKLAMDGHIIPNEVVAGSGTAWTLSHIPNPSNSLKLYANGNRLTLTTDYTISGLTITTINSFSAGTLLADYNI